MLSAHWSTLLYETVIGNRRLIDTEYYFHWKEFENTFSRIFLTFKSKFNIRPMLAFSVSILFAAIKETGCVYSDFKLFPQKEVEYAIEKMFELEFKNPDIRIISSWKTIDTLMSNHRSKVYLLEGGIVCKIQDVDPIKGYICPIIENYALMKVSSHKNVVDYYGTVYRQGKAYTYTEYCPLSLYDLKISLRSNIIGQMLEAVNWVHGQGVSHRDIKITNLRCTEDGTLKIIDWDLSSSYACTFRTPICTIWNRPPEVITINMTKTKRRNIALQLTEEYNKFPSSISLSVVKEVRRFAKIPLLYNSNAIDMWCVGCVVYNLLNKKNIFEANTEKEILDQIHKTIVPKKTKTENLMYWLLQIDPEKRLTSFQAIKKWNKRL